MRDTPLVGTVMLTRIHYDPSVRDFSQRGYIWNALYTVAHDVVECYLTDFYHDALYVADKGKLPAQECTFYSLYGSTGTHILDRADKYYSLESFALKLRHYDRPYVWKCQLLKPQSEYSSYWTFRMECIRVPVCQRKE